MTTITDSEIKMIVIQIILMAILTAMMGLYATSTTPTYNIQTTAGAASTVDTSGSWILGLIYIPAGMETMALISALVLAPFLLMDIPIALRFAKDIATQWV